MHVMVDATLDIPLPGKAISCPISGQEEGASPTNLENFVAGPENRLVEVVIHAVLEGHAGDYNPIFLYGPSGTGKSHLAQGLAAAWKARHRRLRMQCITAVDFARELAEAIESQGVEDFRAKYRQAALAVFEDLGELGQKRSEKLSAQEELIHTLDALVQRGSWVIVTCAKSPAELHDILPALQSRLMAGLTVPLAPPETAARLTILERVARERQFHLPKSAAQFLAEGFYGTVPELLGALTQLEVPARREGKSLDLRTVRRFLDEKKRAGAPEIPQIAAAVAKHFGLKLSELRSPSRRRAVVNARAVAIHLARKITRASLDQIGRYFGGRDHTTMMHSCRKIEELLRDEPAFRQEIELLESFIRQ
jgi:chromosomal replication initiator protein